MLSLISLALMLLIVVGIIFAITYQIPFPPGLLWLKWALPAIALVVVLIVLLHRLGLAN